MEKKLQIPTGDGHVIHGTLNKLGNNEVIIFVHGLTGHQNEHQFYNAVKFFTKKGYDVLRFDLYSGDEKGRLLRECTIDTHAEDLDTVITFVENDYEHVHVVGHSLGGPSIIFANHTTCASVVFWDPSYDILTGVADEMVYHEELDTYVLAWGTEFLLSKNMIESWKKLGDHLPPMIKKPVKILAASDGVLYKPWSKAMDLLPKGSEMKVIDGAGHCFNEEGKEAELFEETLEWIRR